jgi:NADPH-dependent ferric siderophore reductase
MMSIARPLDPEHATQVSLAFDHINDEHPDTVLFVARHLGAHGATAAELDGADVLGVDLRTTGPEGPGSIRLEFASPATTAEDLQGALMAVLGAARAATPDGPLTSLEAQYQQTVTIPVHMVELTGRRTVTPGMIEIELRGGPGLAPPTPDAFFYAMVSDDPELVDETYSMTRYQEDAEKGLVRGAYYTVRRWDPSTATMTFWVVLHGHDTGMSGWLASTGIGTSFGVWGPRTDFDPPTDAAAVLLVADETGLAAAAAAIEHLGPDTRIEGVFEAADGAHRPPMPEHPRLTTRWIHRGGREAGVGDDLVDTVRSLALDGDGWWAFGGAEYRQVTAVRRLLRQELGWPAERVSMTGYWRRGA